MRVTEKGQVAMPKEIRDRLGMGRGSEVDFIASKAGAILLKIETGGADPVRTFDDWASRAQTTVDLGGMTTDDDIEWLRGQRDDLDAR
ncbi:AbrB family looped-hinge helix DNA binding protein [Rhizobium azibense]|uniref:AbrB family looped-hinge helix DNA binding protein n=1 Tax=Rhizobium azibense TaxID=1136135 RepID=A0A4R3QV66_9HYPH|nr:AbrB/MazE/SpoVT family DNA-binding domain-containing protein [Rhizobium azibense]TCU22436.1 AbrB family looped-hinge helix DNA binding protein [Rhizobium azibense]